MVRLGAERTGNEVRRISIKQLIKQFDLHLLGSIAFIIIIIIIIIFNFARLANACHGRQSLVQQCASVGVFKLYLQ